MLVSSVTIVSVIRFTTVFRVDPKDYTCILCPSQIHDTSRGKLIILL